MNLLAYVIVFLVVIYCQNLRIDLPVSFVASAVSKPLTPSSYSTPRISQLSSSHPVSPTFTSFGLLYRQFLNNIFVSILGSWEDFQGQSIPRGGFAYIISPPTSLASILFDPIHAVIYVLHIIISACAWLQPWLEISGMSAKHVYQQFKQGNREISGSPPTYHLLNRYIPTAAAFGGIVVALLTIFADFLGAIGSRTSLLLAANIIHNYHEMLTKEKHEFVD
jgi:protein transport protein SEC61 subunit alpha